MPLAIQMDTYGGPKVLHPAEIALAPLQSGEVRFRVLAAAVNRADIEIRSGKWPILAPSPFPYTPGLEALGDVVEVGEAVESVKPGERVITMMQRLGGIHGIRHGSYQEYVTVMADSVAIVPPHRSQNLGLTYQLYISNQAEVAQRRGMLNQRTDQSDINKGHTLRSRG